MYYYGLINEQQIFDTAVAVCKVLGNGKYNAAHKLMLGTIAAETNFGTFKDTTPFHAGTGLCQLDFTAFQTIMIRTREVNKKKIIDNFNIDINLVKYEWLEYNPLLSILLCRLYYKLIPEEIKDNLSFMAYYWKKYYNTVAGKGNEKKFIDNYNIFIKKGV